MFMDKENSREERTSSAKRTKESFGISKKVMVIGTIVIAFLALLLLPFSPFNIFATLTQVPAEIEVVPTITKTEPELNVTPTVDESNNVSETKVMPGVSPPNVVIINITAYNYGYSPARIEVSKGATVRLVITNTGDRHGFALPEYNISAILPAGERVVIDFNATKEGTFRFYSHVQSTAQSPIMQGELIVK